MKIREFILSAFAVLIMACSPLMAQIVIMNNFDGDSTNDVGPALQLLTNGVVIDAAPVPGTFDPDTGVIMTGTSSTNATGFNSSSLATLDPATTELTATFVVVSASDNTIEVRSNGWFFGLVTGTSGTDQTGAGLFNNSASSIGLNLFASSGSNSRILADGPITGAGATILFPFETEPTNASAEDGFTFVLTLRSDGTYDASTTGLSPEVDVVNAELPVGLAPTFDDFLTGGVGVNSTSQAPSMQYIVSEVTVEATTGTPACILADVDMNGIVDFNDIPDFVTVLLMGPFQCEADCDENGLVDFNDIPFFVDILLGTP